jgi:DNA-binding Xre family transcriptional regulator
MDILVRICAALKCGLHDIVEIVPDESDMGGADRGENV